jgi:hypothetical protein
LGLELPEVHIEMGAPQTAERVQLVSEAEVEPAAEVPSMSPAGLHRLEPNEERARPQAGLPHARVVKLRGDGRPLVHDRLLA